MKTSLVWGLSFCLWSLGGILSALYAHSPQKAPPESLVITPGTLGGDFSLTNHQGQKTSLSQYRGKVVVVNFGYSSCPDVCPLTLSRLAQMRQELGDSAQNVQVFWVTVDPEIDTPAKIQQYLANFDSSFIGLTGTKAEISKAAAKYQAMFQTFPAEKSPEVPPKRLIAHSDFIYILDLQGALYELYPADVPVEALVQTVQDLLPKKL